MGRNLALQNRLQSAVPSVPDAPAVSVIISPNAPTTRPPRPSLLVGHLSRATMHFVCLLTLTRISVFVSHRRHAAARKHQPFTSSRLQVCKEFSLFSSTLASFAHLTWSFSFHLILQRAAFHSAPLHTTMRAPIWDLACVEERIRHCFHLPD